MKRRVIAREIETKKAPARKQTATAETLAKSKTSKPAENDFLTAFFNKQRNRGFTAHVHKSTDKVSTDVFEILCLAMGIIGLLISWIPFACFITPSISLVSAYKTKRKSGLRLAGIILSVVSIIICASIMIILGVNPAVFGI